MQEKQLQIELAISHANSHYTPKFQKRIKEQCQITEREVNTVHLFSLQRTHPTSFPPAGNPDKTVHGTQ
jgi:hypothetical protein